MGSYRRMYENLWQLPSLIGEVKVLYSEGYEERAAYLQDMLQDEWQYLQKPEIIVVKLDLTLVVIDSEDWAKFQEKTTEIYEKFGISFIYILNPLLRQNPKPSEGDPFYLPALDAIHKDFISWTKGPDRDLN